MHEHTQINTNTHRYIQTHIHPYTYMHTPLIIQKQKTRRTSRKKQAYEGVKNTLPRQTGREVDRSFLN